MDKDRDGPRIRTLGAGVASAAAAGSQLAPGPALPALVAAAGFAGGLAVWDAHTHRLPNRTLAMGAATAALLLAAAQAAAGGDILTRALAGAGAGWTAFLMLALARPGALGFGDVKLAAYLAGHLALFGWPTLATGLALPFVLAPVAGAIRLAVRGLRLGAPMAFGPCLVLGAAVAVAWAR